MKQICGTKKKIYKLKAPESDAETLVLVKRNNTQWTTNKNKVTGHNGGSETNDKGMNRWLLITNN